jgi:hypothetical protein
MTVYQVGLENCFLSVFLHIEQKKHPHWSILAHNSTGFIHNNSLKFSEESYVVLLLGIFRRAPCPAATRGHPCTLLFPRGRTAPLKKYCF